MLVFPRRRLLFLLLIACFGLAAGLGLGAFRPATPAPPLAARTVRQHLGRDLAAARREAARLLTVLQLLARQQAPPAQARQALLAAKAAYKRTEYLLEHLDPALARQLNGAPLPRVVVTESDYQALGTRAIVHTTLAPEGLQVLEELLFEDTIQAGPAIDQARRLEAGLTQFAANLEHQALTDHQILSSLPEEVLRVLTMGITGFDAPAAGHELALAAAALEPVQAAAAAYAPAGEAAQRLRQAIDYLRAHDDFDTFDRVYFLRELGDPAYAAVAALPRTLLPAAAPEATLSLPVNPQANSLFAPDFLRPAYYAKQDRRELLAAQAALGQLLFFDPALSANNARACASCHHPSQAFADGQAKSRAFGGQGTVARNAPTLLNASFGSAYFWDARAGFLEDQVPQVVGQADELHTSYEELVPKLLQSPEYRRLFSRAFGQRGGPALTATTINRALAAYLRSLVALNSPFDKYMRRETAVLDASARRGANLFMGKAACATCHFAPIFNGTVPPRFTESETEVIGVPAGPDLDRARPDADPGRGRLVPAEVWQGAFKTPTVRNAARTAPYMHNGVFASLSDVVEFYNRGGGKGLGLDIPHQTLPFDHLSLTNAEKQDLVAFMEALTDTTGRFRAPSRLPEFPARAGLGSRVIGGEY